MAWTIYYKGEAERADLRDEDTDEEEKKKKN